MIEVIESGFSVAHDLVHAIGSYFPDPGCAFAINASAALKDQAITLGLLFTVFDIALL